MSVRRTDPIDLWIDVICPWCLIALKRLEHAAGELGLVPDIRLRAFRLHRDWPPHGMAWRDFQAARNLADAVFDHVAVVGRGDGIDLHFSRIARVPDTTTLHRLLIAAGRRELSLAVYRAMADAYFHAGANLADPATIISLADRAGMTPAAVDAAFVRQDILDAISADEHEAQRLGARGVPFMRLGGNAVAGAQSLAAYSNLLQRNLLATG